MVRSRALAGVAVALAALSCVTAADAFWPVGTAGITGAPALRSAPVRHPRLSLSATDPLRVRGTHFRAGEAIRLTVRAGDGPRRARTVADTRGAFRATIQDVTTSCTPITVTAVGASGDRAATQLPIAC
jgi:hypothetical protein